MNDPIARFLQTVLRGFGQLYLCNRPLSGLLIVIGLVIISPPVAAGGLIGAVAATLYAWAFGCRRESGSGLFGVNGALIGMFWTAFPELDPNVSTVTILVSAMMAAGILACWSHTVGRRIRITLFALPAIAVTSAGLIGQEQRGLLDHALRKGRRALAQEDYKTARSSFAVVRTGNDRVTAFRREGAGWAEYLSGNWSAAESHFREARRLLPYWADAATGHGWALFKLGRTTDAAEAFRSATTWDARQAHAWDGLGWVRLTMGDAEGARRAFEQARFLLPFYDDPQLGIAYTYSAVDPAESARQVRSAVERGASVPRSVRFISRTQLIGWAVCFLGVLWHSRVTAAAVIAAVSAYIGIFAWSPVIVGGPARSTVDYELLYNLIPLGAALLGQYMRMTVFTLVWTAGLCLAIAAVWPAVSQGMDGLNLPVQSLPFHVALIGSTVLLRMVPWARHSVVDLEAAVTSPYGVRVWYARKQNATECEALLRASDG